MQALDILDVGRMAIAGIVVAAGLIFLAGGALGLLRFPDVYTRLHAANAADTTGAALVSVGLAIGAPDGAIAIRLVMLAALIVALGPTVTQLVANAAHAAGLAPIAGPYAAPRPNAPRADERT